jgi:hypothetical protein
MIFQGGMDLQALAALNNIDPLEAEPAALAARAFDSDGDGRPDLFAVDLDADGAVDGVVKAFDTNGDGANDTFIQYKEDGSVQSIGRVNPATGELDVVYEEPGLIEEILAALGLIDLPTPEEALFGSFESSYFMDTFGSYGMEVPDFYEGPDVVEDFDVTEVSPEAAEAMEMEIEAPEAVAEGADFAEPGMETVGGIAGDAGADSTGEADAEPEADRPAADVAAEEGGEEPAPPEVTPRITEIEDRSGGAGSSLWAKVDQDGDGIADHDVRIEGTSTGTFYGDIDKNGYSEEVATDLDMDGRIDTVHTTGRPGGADSVDAAQVVDPGSSHLVDQAPGEDDDAALAAGVVDAGSPDTGSDAGVYDSGAAADDGIDSGADHDAGVYDSGAGSVDSGADYEAGSSYDSGSSIDTSSTDPDPD